ncbi:hypothetical protein [Kribbella sp. HUAS MG21]|uniref:Lipoprotein n=1 Tax=Kribbella sp. HUAS MG21 TaxID=3160966 RepID=A0AAU7TH58_9ACTN
MRKWVGAAAAAVVGTSSLTGCGVPSGGILGVMVDGRGEPSIVVQMCEGHIDGATLYLEDPDPDRMPAQHKTMGTWEVSPPVTGFSQFFLDTGGNGWRVAGTLMPREPETRYTIYGWSKDNSWSASHLSFSEHELANLGPGTVRVPDNEPEAQGNRTVSLADFRTKTCEEWF